MLRHRAVLIGLLFAACAAEPQLLPDDNAERVGATRNAATAESAGVQLFVDGDAWRGQPVQLGEVLTPVRITLENRSGRPLRVTAVDFALVGKQRYEALRLERRDDRRPVSMRMPRVVLAEARFASRGFFVLPSYEKDYPKHEPWPRNLRGPPQGRSILMGRLPSDDMLSEGIPDGVLENGGYVNGFIYFERVDPKEKSVTFECALSDPDSGERFGTVSIPLAVKW